MVWRALNVGLCGWVGGVSAAKAGSCRCGPARCVRCPDVLNHGIRGQLCGGCATFAVAIDWIVLVTVSPDRQPIVVSDLSVAADAVRGSGLRLTSARRLVLEALLAARSPVSAEDIADGLGGRMTQSDIASVYRNLETLGELGLVRHFHAGHGPGRYVLEGLGDCEYLACESCGALESVDPEALDGVRDAVRKLSGFEARFSHFPIVGLCPRCAKERDARSTARRN